MYSHLFIGYPKSKPVMELPFSIVEDEPISIKGRWSSGFPDSYGELDWYIIAPDNDRENPWTDAKKTVNTKNCQNEAASIISLQATLALNRTKIKLQPHFHEQYLAESERHKVEPVIKEILVVPGKHLFSIQSYYSGQFILLKTLLIFHFIPIDY